MRARYLLALVMLFASPVVAFAQQTNAASRLAVKPAGDLQWADLAPGVPVKVVDVRGNHVSGAFGAFFRFPAGFTTPLHTHSQDMKIVILSGTFVQAPEGKPEFRLGPGSYLMQPGGDYRHTTRCDPASDCVVFIESDGAFDRKVAEPPK